jgi:hypothetical protein
MLGTLKGPTVMVLEEQKEIEVQEPNLAFEDDHKIDFEKLRRDLTPDQRLALAAILLQL